MVNSSLIFFLLGIIVSVTETDATGTGVVPSTTTNGGNGGNSGNSGTSTVSATGGGPGSVSSFQTPQTTMESKSEAGASVPIVGGVAAGKKVHDQFKCDYF